MEFKNLRYEAREQIGIRTINRPKSLNALNVGAIKETRSLLVKVAEGKNVRILIVTGPVVRAFIAGADISEIQGLGLSDAFEFSRLGRPP